MAAPEDGEDTGKDESSEEVSIPLSNLAKSITSSESESGEESPQDFTNPAPAAESSTSNTTPEVSETDDPGFVHSVDRPDEAESVKVSSAEKEASKPKGETEVNPQNEQQSESSEPNDIPLSELRDEMEAGQDETQTREEKRKTKLTPSGTDRTSRGTQSDNSTNRDQGQDTSGDTSEASPATEPQEEPNYRDDPLGDLRARIENRNAESGRATESDSSAEDPLDIGRSPDGTTPHETSERGSTVDSSEMSHDGSNAGGSDAGAAKIDGVSGMDGQISRTFVTIHIGLTAFSFIAALAIYFSAIGGLIDQFLWILSLPLFTLTLFGLVPIAARYTGYWNPAEIE